MRQLNRIQPAGPAAAYDTYRISAPISTHRRRATCAEVDCKHHLEGWATIVDVSSELGQDQADYIRTKSGRQFELIRTGDSMWRFEFKAGQKCSRAADHTMALERDALFIRHRGDWRKRDRPVTYDRADQWVDDFATNQDRLSTLRGE